MPKVLASPVFAHWFDNLGDVLNGGKIYTYEGGTVTPITTWTSDTGAVAQANPIVLDSAGREPGGVWITEGVAVKFVLKSSADVTLDTIDNVTIGDAAGADDDEYEVVLTYTGTPGAQAWMGGVEFKRSVTFPANFTGSGGSVVTSPASDFEIDVQKNGAAAGTITIASTGVFTFVTVGGAAIAVADGDTFDFYGDDAVGVAANFKATLVGDLA